MALESPCSCEFPRLRGDGVAELKCGWQSLSIELEYQLARLLDAAVDVKAVTQDDEGHDSAAAAGKQAR